MRRREFITLAAAVAACPLAARAQRSEPLRRIGVLYATAQTDPVGQAWDAVFRKQLDELGWIEGGTVHIDYRWGAGNLERTQLSARELVRLAPDVLFAITTPATAALQRETQAIPSCSPLYPIRLVQASLPAWPVRAAISPGSTSSKPR